MPRLLPLALALLLLSACDRGVAPPLSVRKALKTFTLPEGYSIELVASEPLVHDPVAIDFDADGRMYVVEMSGYMPTLTGDGENLPNGRIVVLEDTDDDGRADRRTVFLDSLVLPRTVAVLERGVLVGAPPMLWLVRDTTGDLRADTRQVVSGNYGSVDANPEHNANGARWGMDNWLHTANHTAEYRLRHDGTFIERAIPSVGQWGVASDEYGRLYRNSNEDPLRTDLIPAHYAARDGGTATIRGVYAALTSNVPVWPAHKTPAINRGYRERTMRPDSSLAHYTSAGAPTPYVGDRLPAELRSSLFVTEPAGNLIGQFDVFDRPNGARVALRAEEQRDFLTSTDERFRPVFLSNAPDGTLYIVDMYRGVIQHRTYVTDYLAEKVRERGLEQPIGYGRIYRIVHASATRGPRPTLSRASTAELVAALTRANGWWRITAQRLIVERNDRAAVAGLRALRVNGDDRVRLHALWTLEGLGVVDSADIVAALADASPHVRVAALRLSEKALAGGSRPMLAAVQALVGDSSASVHRQLAASLGELPVAMRDAALWTVLERGVTDVVAAELIARGAGARAPTLLDRLVTASAGGVRGVERDQDAKSSPAIEALAAAVGRTNDGAQIQRALARAMRSSDAARAAALAGLARGVGTGRNRVTVSAPPSALLALAADTDSVTAAAAARVANALKWPGKPAPPPVTARALTPVEQERVAEGRAVFGRVCAACHQADGAGAANVAASLHGSVHVNGSPLRLIRILLQGREGTLLMPPVGATMSDADVAAVLSFVRREWGNLADPIAPADVKEIRGATTGRKRPWTDAELAQINR